MHSTSPESVRSPGPPVVVHVAGDIDLVTAPAMERRLTAVMTGAPLRLIVDLAAVTFMDGSGLAALRRARAALAQNGGTLRLAAPPEHLMWVMRVARLYDGFEVYGTVEEAERGRHR